jgi:hypothetical protein
MDWVNPHVWIHLEVKNQDGSVTGWMVEGGSPNAPAARGFTRIHYRWGRSLLSRLSWPRMGHISQTVNNLPWRMGRSSSSGHPERALLLRRSKDGSI